MTTALDNKTLNLVIEYIYWVKLNASSNEDIRNSAYNNVLNLEQQLLELGLTEERLGQIAKAVR